MRLLTSVLMVILMASFSVQAQEPAMGAPAMAPTSTNEIAIKLNKSTGKIELVNKQNANVTRHFELSHLELEIFDSKGEYAGSLELQDFLIPQNEVEKSEKVKVANIRFKNTTTGQEMTLTNVDFIK